MQLVVLVEQLAARGAGSRGVLYGGGCLTSFAEVYKHLRALGQVRLPDMTERGRRRAGSLQQ